jgi:hypothetical protein
LRVTCSQIIAISLAKPAFTSRPLDFGAVPVGIKVTAGMIIQNSVWIPAAPRPFARSRYGELQRPRASRLPRRHFHLRADWASEREHQAQKNTDLMQA